MEFSQIVKLEYNKLYYIRIKQIVLKRWPHVWPELLAEFLDINHALPIISMVLEGQDGYFEVKQTNNGLTPHT